MRVCYQRGLPRLVFLGVTLGSWLGLGCCHGLWVMGTVGQGWGALQCRQFVSAIGNIYDLVGHRSVTVLALVQVCYIREKAEKGAPDGICCAEGSVRFRTQMSENSRLESIKGVTELKSNKLAKVKSKFEAKNSFKEFLKFAPCN